MPDQPITAFANEQVRERRTIADVNPHLFQRGSPVVDEHQIRRVENAPAAGAHAVSNGRSQEGVLDRECLERDVANLRGRAFLDQSAILDWASSQCAPCLPRRVYGAGGAFFQTPRRGPDARA